MNARHESIKYRLRLKGSSLSAIARSLGRDKATVTLVSQGKGTSSRIQRAIAEALGDSVEELFPKNLDAA